MRISAGLQALMLVLVGVLVLVTQLWGKRSQRTGKLEQTSMILGSSMIVVWLLYNLYYLQPARFRWDVSLPLHACDVISVIAGIVLIRPCLIGRAILYFAAFPLTTQAFITPTGDQDPATYRFWLYWTLHAGIVACSAFDLTLRGYRPTVRDFLAVIAVDIAYALLVIPLNTLLGWNYGYLGDAVPDGRTAVDFLGPWPQRMLLILGIVAALQLSMLVLWLGYHRLRHGSNRAIRP